MEKLKPNILIILSTFRWHYRTSSHLEHPLHIETKQILFAQLKHGQSDLEYDLHTLGQEDVEDATGERQAQGSGEKREKPRGRVHGCVEALGREVGVKLGVRILDEVFQLVHAHAELGHAWLEHVTETVVVH